MRERNSNFEAFRIFCMLLIVAHHYSQHGFFYKELDFSINKIIIDIISLGAKVGIAGFIFISAYFMVTSRFTLKKFLELEGEIWFYSVTILLLFLTILKPVEEITALNIFQSIFPTIYGRSNMYWFATYYIILMLLSPFLNIFIHKSTKKELGQCIFILFTLWSVLAIFLRADLGCGGIGWFIELYLIAGYIRLYFEHDCKKAKKHLMRGIFLSGLLIMSVIIFDMIGLVEGYNALLPNSNSSLYFAQENSPLIMGIAVEFFLYIVNKEPTYNKLINQVAKATFGVYLIHDNYLMRQFLWRRLFHNIDYFEKSSIELIIHALYAIVTVYVVCTVVELIRMNTVGKIWSKIVNKYSIDWQKYLTSVITSWSRKIRDILE